MDIDDELQMLQRELMQVQQQKTNPLSERTVAEIMIKLHQEGFKFYPTTDGNQYVTPSKLDNEIIQFVQERGRTKIGILPQILNLSQDLIQSRLNNICHKSTHIRNNDNLLSRDYLRNFVHSLKQRLQVDGVIELDQVALAHEFNMAFLMKIIQQNLNQLDAEVHQKQLVTKQYTRMKKKRILGFLLAMNRPVNIQTILKSVKLSDPASQSLIEELIQQGKLKGRCQNSYYIPEKFSKNQKQMVQKFFENNGFLDFAMLQKNFQISRPQQWIKKNLKGQYLIFQQVCFNRTKLDSYQVQIQSLLKGQGFFEISNVVPFELDDRKMEKFLTQLCGVNDFVLEQGICYSEQWLNRCVNQFRDKVIYDIFFKKNQPKGKKKGAKKEKQPGLTQEEIVQTLFDAGLAEYSVAEGMAGSLLPLLTQRFENLKTQLQKQLTQSQGMINNAFLKYKKCKTIIKTAENLQRVLNTIQKLKKKGGEWVDPDFGPSQTNTDGKFSLIYYDGVPPKQWPALQNIKWVELSPKEILNVEPAKSKFMNKCLLLNLLEIFDHFNINHKGQGRIQTPNVNKIPSRIEQGQVQPTAPFTFRFYVNEQECRYVLIDNKIPFVNQEPVSSGGIYGLIEKAYAKLRYCYKAILSVGINQLIFELTGLIVTKLIIENQKDQQKVLTELTQKHIGKNSFVLVMGEGVAGKKIKLDGDETEFKYMKPYSISNAEGEDGAIKLFPGESVVPAKLIPKLFKNIYVVNLK